jgi:predicted nuclease of predicted toxin-antitoxin system
MIGLAFDENLNHDIWRGLLRRKPTLDVVCVQDAGLSSWDDPSVLAWAAQEGRVLVSHDVSTLTAYAHARVRAG